VAVAAIAILLAAGRPSSRSVAAPTGPATGSGIADHTLIDRNGVSIVLPLGWADWREDERGWSYVVMRDHRIRVRIEVTPNVRTDDPAVLANRARRIARRRPGYHQIRFLRETMNGEDTVRFDYLLRESGTKLRTESVFFVDLYGRGIGFFEQVPADGYPAWRHVFERMRGSLTIVPETMDLPVRPVAPSG
jgi:hypothetical protein